MPGHSHKGHHTLSKKKSQKCKKQKSSSSSSSSSSKCKKEKKHHKSKAHKFKNAFAYVYNQMPGTSGQVLAGCADAMNSSAAIAWNNQGVFCGIKQTSPTTLQLPVAGVYEANYTVNTASAVGSTSSAASFKLTSSCPGNTANTIPGSVFFGEAGDQVIGQVKFCAPACSQIQLVNNSLSPQTLASLSSSTTPTVRSRGSTAVFPPTAALTAPSIDVLQGSSVYVVIYNNVRTSEPAVTDNQGATYNLAVTTEIARARAGVSIFYRDNVTASSNLVVTANGIITYGIQVVEIQGADPAGSLDQTGSTSGIGNTASVSIIASQNNELGFMGLGYLAIYGSTSIENAIITGISGTQLISQDRIITTDGENLQILDTDFQKSLATAGSYTMDALINDPNQTITIDGWGAVAVSIKGIPGSTGSPFCTPPNNASLDIKLLQEVHDKKLTCPPLFPIIATIPGTETKHCHKKHTHKHKHSSTKR